MNTGVGLDWSICGVGLRSEDRKARDDLAGQDYLFTLYELGDTDDHPCAHQEPSRVLDFSLRGATVSKLSSPSRVPRLSSRAAFRSSIRGASYQWSS